jgi:hypothetical protein
MGGVKNASHSKISGEELATFHGLTIYGKLMMPKRRGKARVLIQIRPDKNLDLRVSQSLSYGRAVDILFATDSFRNNKGQLTSAR